MGDQVSSCLGVIGRKHILIDTCILIDLVTHLSEEGGFFDFYTMLLQSDCVPIISPFISYELLSGELSIKARKVKEAILGGIEAQELPLPQEIYEWTQEFSWVYASQKWKDAKMVDFSNLVYLRKYPNEVLLATTNHKDFSLKILDRVFTYTVDDCDKKIFNISFYKWNEQKYTSLVTKLEHLL